MNKQYILNNIFFWYEPEINNGTLFLFNKDTGDMFEGNLSAYLVIQQLLTAKTIEEMCLNISEEIGVSLSPDLFISVSETVRSLLDSGFVSEQYE